MTLTSSRLHTAKGVSIKSDYIYNKQMDGYIGLVIYYHILVVVHILRKYTLLYQLGDKRCHLITKTGNNSFPTILAQVIFILVKSESRAQDKNA